MDAESFVIAANAFLSLMPMDSGWLRREQGFLALDGLCWIKEDGGPLVSSFHIVYHTTYREPVLYFNHCDSRGRIVQLAPGSYGQGHADGSLLDVISQNEHPVLGIPYFFIHPCHTTTFMATLNVPPALYLYSWYSWVARLANAPVPMVKTTFEISVCTPIFNAASFLGDMISSIANQSWKDKSSVQVVFYDDCSTDDSHSCAVRLARTLLSPAGFTTLILRNTPSSGGKGCGWARNRCADYSLGKYICFQDADDIMHPDRLVLQHKAAQEKDDTLIGCMWRSFPKEDTPWTEWHNTLVTPEQLLAARFREVSLPQPTWFMSRKVWDTSGPYDQGPNAIEDMNFFYRHLKRGGSLWKVGGAPLLHYRIHDGQISRRIHRNVLLQLKAAAFSEWVCSSSLWKDFGIWGCGRDGRKFYGFLSEDAKKLVRCFYEIDPRKGGAYQDKVKLFPVEEVVAPFVCCVSIGKNNGIEEKLARFVAGSDYFQIT